MFPNSGIQSMLFPDKGDAGTGPLCVSILLKIAVNFDKRTTFSFFKKRLKESDGFALKLF
jgi:hypothetical protein